MKNFLDYLRRLKAGFNVRQLSLFFLATGFILSALLYIPFSLILNGDWKLNQQIDLFFIESLDLFDVSFPIGNVSIRFYSICILTGLLAGYSLVLYLSKRNRIASTTIDRMFVGMVIVGLAGARLFYVAVNWEQFVDVPIEIFTEITRGGLAVFGMIIACGLYLWSYCSRFKFNFFEFADVLIPGVLLGQIIGRFGNFFNYESYGGPTSAYWKMYVPQTANLYTDPTQSYFHPTFLYEIIPNFFLLIVLLYFYEKLTLRRSGIIFGLYAMGYGLIRFGTEFFRLDALKIPLPEIVELGPFTFEFLYVSQVSAIILFLIGVVTVFYRSKVIYSKKTMVEIKV
ncbi:MAG: prolipoprotein diacylglyceryl transferase [Patescibacteria group bacterium]